MDFLIINLEALTLGSIVLPNILFMLYFIQQDRTAVAALPVIFFYVMAKTIPYAIRSFGNVKNPYRLLLASNGIALIGIGLTFLKPLIPEGATLLGIGMGSLQPAYQQLKDEYRSNGQWHHPKTAIGGIIHLLVALSLGMLLSRLTISAFVGELAVIIILAIFLVIKLPNPWPQIPTFNGPLAWRPAIVTLLIFGIVLGTRGLKQTGSFPLALLTLGIWIIMLFGLGHLHHRFKSSRLWTFWTSAATNFFLIYSLFYFDTLDLMPQLFMAYGLFIIASIGGLLLSSRLRQQSIRWLSIAGLLLSIVPNNWCYLIGLFITCLCCSSINTVVWPAYRNDPTIPPLNNRFVRKHFNILGTVVSQATLLSLLMITNLLFNHHGGKILYAYYEHTPNRELGEPLWLTRVVCVALLIITMLILTNHQTDNDKQ